MNALRFTNKDGSINAYDEEDWIGNSIKGIWNDPYER